MATILPRVLCARPLVELYSTSKTDAVLPSKCQGNRRLWKIAKEGGGWLCYCGSVSNEKTWNTLLEVPFCLWVCLQTWESARVYVHLLSTTAPPCRSATGSLQTSTIVVTWLSHALLQNYQRAMISPVTSSLWPPKARRGTYGWKYSHTNTVLSRIWKQLQYGKWNMCIDEKLHCLLQQANTAPPTWPTTHQSPCS